MTPIVQKRFNYTLKAAIQLFLSLCRKSLWENALGKSKKGMKTSKDGLASQIVKICVIRPEAWFVIIKEKSPI